MANHPVYYAYSQNSSTVSCMILGVPCCCTLFSVVKFEQFFVVQTHTIESFLCFSETTRHDHTSS